jgi:hypothetical protein
MLALLEFLDTLALDDRLYWRLPRREGQVAVELMWQRAQKPEAWSVRETGAEAWTTSTREALPDKLTALSVADATVEKMLGATVMTQAVFADMVLEGAARIFGRDAVERSVRETRTFLAEVSATASQLLGSPGARTSPRANAQAAKAPGAKAPGASAGSANTGGAKAGGSRLRLV